MILAMMYFLDHIVMGEVLNIKRVYKVGFYISLLLFVYFSKRV